ncbi:toxin PIN [Enterococcus hirae]|uniref:toxin PIN n=1 Tax=Enterococcus hirae TaxID=1354 RepID=UPI0029006C4D|nr:toxin PIN [Enterococcus hirae]
MNDRHRRVAKLKKQELNTAKAKFKNEYGISAEEAVRLIRKFVKAFGQMLEDFGKAFASLGKNLRRHMEEKE